MIGRVAKRSRARQCGMRLSIGISTALHRRKQIFDAEDDHREDIEGSKYGP